MGLQTSGAISIGDIATEFGGTAPHALSEYYGAASGVPTSGAINVASHFYGKSSVFQFTISSNTANANLATLATNAGWDGSSLLEATIASGVYVYSTSTNTPALTVSGSFPAGVTLINNGYIVGKGGNGGSATSGNGQSGSAGGTALSVSSAITINNLGVVGGGGGGGGGGKTTYDNIARGGGGGGGGGQSGISASSGGSGYSSGGSGTCSPYAGSSGGSGTTSSAGSGGARGRGGRYDYGCIYTYGGNGGSGGSWGSSGSAGSISGSGGGGAGGACTSGNSNITWSATGTRYGALG